MSGPFDLMVFFLHVKKEILNQFLNRNFSTISLCLITENRNVRFVTIIGTSISTYHIANRTSG